MTTLNIRIDEKTKRKAKRTLEDLGLDLSTAVKMFLNQVIHEKGMPFRASKRSPKEIRAEWDKGVEEALKNGKVYYSGREVLEDLL